MVQLEQVRGDAGSNGPEWLGSALQDIKRDELRELARAAGLRVRKDDNVAWMSVGDLRKKGCQVSKHASLFVSFDDQFSCLCGILLFLE